MTETTTYSPDQQFQPSQSGEFFAAPNPMDRVPEIPTSAIKGADSPEVWEQATADAHEASEPIAQGRLVFNDVQRGDFDIARTNPQVAATFETNRPTDAAYYEMLKEREARAAQEAESRAAESEQVQAISWNGIAIKSTRDHELLLSRDKFGLAA